MLARLLTVTDDVDAGVLLVLDGEQSGVALGFVEQSTLEPPRRPKGVGLGQPSRLWQAASNGCLEHGRPSATGLVALLPAMLTPIIADERPRESSVRALGTVPRRI